MYDLLIKNAITPDTPDTRTDIFIEDGIISRVGPALSSGRADVLDAAGRYILPGLIDMDCHICEPGYENREDIASASKSAAKGGFTSFTCRPCTYPVIDNKTTVHYVLAKSYRESMVHVFPYGSMTLNAKGERMAEIGEMIKAGIVAVTNAGCVPEDAVLLRNVLAYTRMFDIPVITVCNDPALSGGGVMHLGEISNKLGLVGIPREAEETMVARNIILARYAGARLHIAPVSTRGSVSLVRQAKREGVNLTCGTCSHYLSLTEEAADGYNTLAKTMPPLRTADDAAAVMEGLADGTIDVIASGHTPDTVENVMCEFDRASFGLSSLETAFCAAYTAITACGTLTLKQLSDKMSSGPAGILSLTNKGRIAEGCDADLFLLNTECSYTVDASVFASKAKYSPYQGRSFSCTVDATIVDGRIVYLRE